MSVTGTISPVAEAPASACQGTRSWPLPVHNLVTAFGTSGVEVPLERRTRLLAHGLLLEYDHPDRLEPVVFPHPLLGLEG